MDSQRQASGLAELARTFGRLGLLGFGGPAAHIALMEEEVVQRRRWLSADEFKDVVGLTNLIPGPNSTEIALHIGLLRAGLPGMLVVGACFILPAVVLSTLLAWLYLGADGVGFSTAAFVGVDAAVLAVIAVATLRMARGAVTSWRLFVLGAGVAAAVSGGMSEVVGLLGGGLLGMIWLSAKRLGGGGALAALALSPLPTLLGEAHEPPSPLLELAAFFGKVGVTLYGSGYVLLSFLEAELVRERGWLTAQQLLDAIAAGHMTPGPLSSTAAFVGYLVAGVPGAVVASVAMFLPAFVFTGLLRPLVPKLRGDPLLKSFVDSVSVCAIALIALVLVNLGRATLVGWQAWLVTALALVTVTRLRLPGTLVILGGGLLGAALLTLAP